MPRFFDRAEMAAVARDFDTIFGPPERHADRAPQTKAAAFDAAQFEHFDSLPFDCSRALNLIAVHPKLIDLARRALSCDGVRLYQGQAWAKYTGAANYEQPFHCDFVNHTLTVPSETAVANAITFIILVTDVTEAHGPTHYVPRSESAKLAGPEDTLRDSPDLQTALARHASAAGPAGTLFAYGIDVYHRGTDLTAPNGHRYVVTACFKRAGNDTIGYRAWPYHVTQPWRNVFDHATPQQLACFGVPMPGDPFWTERTLAQTALRWPGWDPAPYRAAMTASAQGASART